MSVLDPRSYTVSIVGEQFYQDAIEACDVGQAVTFAHEFDNPYDERAIAVLNEDRRVIGHLSRDSWLHDALLDQQRGASAIILDVDDFGRGFVEIRLTVTLPGPQIESKAWKQHRSP